MNKMPRKITTEDIFKLVAFTQKFAAVTRAVKICKRESYESDAEHSYQLGLVAWYVAKNLKSKLNTGKIFMYAAVHDLVEVYAGDTDAHASSTEHINSKARREKAAQERIALEFPNFPELHKAICSYNKLSDLESKLVYIIDKVLPVINTNLARDDYYIKNNISFAKWQKWLEAKIKKANAEKLLGPKFFTDLVSVLENSKELFAN